MSFGMHSKHYRVNNYMVNSSEVISLDTSMILPFIIFIKYIKSPLIWALKKQCTTIKGPADSIVYYITKKSFMDAHFEFCMLAG